MSRKYCLDISEDYGHSWRPYTIPAAYSIEEMKEQLRKARENSTEDRRKVRYRIDIVEPDRPDPVFAEADELYLQIASRVQDLSKWMKENYVGRTIVREKQEPIKVNYVDVVVKATTCSERDEVGAFFWGVNNSAYMSIDELKKAKLE